jgi:hypothetical protein
MKRNMKSALRRHHAARLKQKRKNYWGLNLNDPWVKETWTEYDHKKRLGRLVNTPKPCSCWMCRNERQDYGPTLQEVKFYSSDDEG